MINSITVASIPWIYHEKYILLSELSSREMQLLSKKLLAEKFIKKNEDVLLRNKSNI